MGKHPILEYCERHKITKAKFGRLCGISPQFIGAMTRGENYPSRDNALAIRDATGGEIPLGELLAWERPTSAESPA